MHYLKRFNTKFTISVGLAGLTALLAGCGGGSSTTAKEKCEALAGVNVAADRIALPTKGASVAKASWVEATSTIPEYCNVEGKIASMDPAAEPISFRVALPTAWNHKLLHLGGGGWDGVVPDVINAPALMTSGPLPIARGYAVFSSDSGHAVKAGTNPAIFALNDEMLRNFTGDQLKKTRDTAYEVVRRRYSEPVQKTYFMGNSGGGRESMVAIQRYPNDYDGVYTLFPAFNWSALFMKFNAIGVAMRSNGGAGWINPNKELLLRNAATAACDQQDGLADGVISHPEACQFSAATLRCPGGADTGDTCLSDAQIATTDVMFSRLSWSYALSNGVQSIAPFLPGTNFSVAGSLGTTPAFDLATVMAGKGPASIGNMHTFGDAFVRFIVMHDVNADTFGFDIKNPGAHLPRLQEMSKLLDASSTNVDAFIARGGKWILAHGDADQLVHVTATNEYYEKLLSAYGQEKLDKTMRYYRIPGYAHGGGVFNTNNGIATLDLLENWAERGQAPGAVVATDTASPAKRTRPLCAYPEWPQYKGSGDPDAAASFACVR